MSCKIAGVTVLQGWNNRQGITHHSSVLSTVSRPSCFAYVRHLQTCNINLACPVFQRAENADDEL